MLLARGHAPGGPIVLGSYTVQVEESPAAYWVVDGQQRIITLAMALIEEMSATHRPLYFDLVEQKFILGQRRRAPAPHWVPTPVLLSSSSLNRWLRETAVADELCDRADDIARRIREYTLPAYVVPYDGRDDRVLREIFARINQRGHALESYEVFQALHTSFTGGMGPIDRARDDLLQSGFGVIDPSNIERAAIAVAGGDPGRSLQEQLTADVGKLFEQVTTSLALTIDFLVSDVGVPHIELLPYSGVLFPLARFFSLHPRPHERSRELLCRWFWRGALSGDHRTDNRTDRKRWQIITSDEHASVKGLLGLLPWVGEPNLPQALAPFRRGTARVNLELLAMNALRPRLLVGAGLGTEVDVASLIESEGTRFPCQLQERGLSDEKTCAQFLLHPHPLSAAELSSTKPTASLLATHAIDAIAWQALSTGDLARFELRRTELLLAHIRQFLHENARLAPFDRDRLPLDAYFGEESA